MAMWPRASGALQVFPGQGVEAPRPSMGITGGYDIGFEGGVAHNPGGVNLFMARNNIEAARRASEVLGEEVVPLAGTDWQEDTGIFNPDTIPGTVLPAYTSFLRAAYDAESFRPESGDERRIIGDKYRIARELGGKSDEQFKRARLLDPSIPDLDEQRRRAIAETNAILDKSDRANTNIVGTVSWLAGEIVSTVEPATNPAWALNILGLGGKSVALRVGGQAVVSGAQSLTEDLMPLAGLPSREEAMAWLGRDNDVVLNAVTAAVTGAAFQAAGEALAKAFAIGSTTLKAKVRAMPSSERMVLDSITPDPSARVREGQKLDTVERQLNDGVPANEVLPPAAPLGQHASVMPDSAASIEPVVRNTTSTDEIEILARAKKLDQEAHTELAKATKQADKFTIEKTTAIETEIARVTRQLDIIDRAIQANEAARGSISELQGLEQQRELLLAAHEQSIRDITSKLAKREAVIRAKLVKWKPLVDDSLSHARGEWRAREETRAQERATVAQAQARAGVPLAEETPSVPAPAPLRPIGEPLEQPAPPTESFAVRDTGEGTPAERVQRVTDQQAKQAVLDSKAWVADVKAKIGELEQAIKSKGVVDPNSIVLADGTPVNELMGLQLKDIETGDNGVAMGKVYDLQRELDDLDELGEVERVVTTCRTHS